MDYAITRAALGSSASLGSLYDARRDDFCGISIFKKAIPKGALTLMDSNFSDVHLAHSDDFSEKFSKMDVSAELSVSVLAGLFTLSGSGRYLNDRKKSARTVKSSLIYNVKTKEETVNIYHEDLKDAFAIDAIESGIATHVVVGISWGANSIVSCLYENQDNRDVKEISGKLSTQLKNLKFSISGKGSVDFSEGENSKGIKFEFRMFGDILPKDEVLPTTFEGALELMKKLPNLVASSNQGRGKPLTYKLLPVPLLQNYLKFAISVDKTIKSLEETSLLRVVQLFDQMSAAQQQLHDFYQDAINFKYCIRKEDLLKISSFKNEMAIQETSFRSKLATVLTEVRSGKNDVAKLEDLIKIFQSSDVSPQNVTTTLETWAGLLEKINFARMLVQSGAKYIGLGGSLDAEILKDFEAKSFVFYFKQDAKSEDAQRWAGNRQLLFQEMNKNDDGSRYYAVDCDIHPTLMIQGCSSCVQVLQAGKVISEDLLTEHETIEETSWAQATSGTEPLLFKPNKRAPLEIKCSGLNCDPAVKFEWTCTKCETVIDYGFDHHVYCDCGKTSVNALEFKCPHPKHGLAFQRQDDNFLIELVNQLRPFPEMNILILGETRVGKSTWINGFINVLTYESLEKAENGEPIILIPSEFSVCDGNFKQIIVSTGTDKNEVRKAGHSTTQDTKVYRFTIGRTTVRLIDTPGIGDTRGYEQDKKNFENIVGTLSNLEELHGICILLKPDSARLAVTFRFCIKELFKYLHRDASKNIVFCFTNCRNTFYRPGDTLPALQQLLGENKYVEIPVSKHTVYCYDSEAYRFLAAVKNKIPVTFSEDAKASFSNSWIKSIEETGRMLKHIKGLQPHPIKSTVNLNEARQLVLRLVRPLAEITRKVQTNRTILAEETEQIMKAKESINELRKRQMITRTEIEVKRLPCPKTVCSNSRCVKTHGEGGRTMTEYVTVCHEPCGCIPDVTEDCVGHPGLRNCPAMRNGICCRSNCGHSYREHLHIWYDSVQVSKQVEDKSVTEALEKNVAVAEMKQRMIDAKIAETVEYEGELKEIERSSVRFAWFLKRNAMTPNNDAIEQYLNHVIREEEEKVNQGGNKTTLENLKICKASCAKEKKILDEAIEMGYQSGNGDSIGPEDVTKLVDKLKTLKHSGQTLKEALECLEKTRNVVYQEITVQNSSCNGQMAQDGISYIWRLLS